MMNSRRLFSGPYLKTFLEQRKQQILNDIETYESDDILNASIDDLCGYLESEYHIDAPVLNLNETQVLLGEYDTTVGGAKQKLPYYQYEIPFEGNAEVFNFRFYMDSISVEGNVSENKLFLTYQEDDTEIYENSSILKKRFDSDVKSIRTNLEPMRKLTDAFNANLRELAYKNIEERKAKILRAREMVASLGYTVKKRDDAPEIYNPPQKRKKIPKPSASGNPYQPEYQLLNTAYENILKTISDMTTVMERSPRAFSEMGEEDIRWLLLVPLNGLYEGDATGETFNFEGKTDILIRHEGRNLFIAECKFWKGEQVFRETIDQLLGYTCWRDTKTAIIVFNRNKNLSGVLEQIPGIVQSHPNFKRQLEYACETGFRFKMHHRDDKNREIYITVLVFDVPAAGED